MNRTITLDKHEMVINKDDYESLINELKELRKLKLSKQELEDRAYEIATGTCTTTIKSKYDWDKCKTSDFTWEPFEGLGDEFIEKHISEIAYNIIEKFKHLIKD